MTRKSLTLRQRASQSLTEPEQIPQGHTRGFLVQRPHFRASVAATHRDTDCWQELGIAVVEQALRDLHSMSPHVRAELVRSLGADALEPWISLACGADVAACERVKCALAVWMRRQGIAKEPKAGQRSPADLPLVS